MERGLDAGHTIPVCVTCPAITLLDSDFVTHLPLDMAFRLVLTIVTLLPLALRVQAENDDKTLDYDPSSTKIIPMEKLNLWIDGKETEQFVGEW